MYVLKFKETKNKWAEIASKNHFIIYQLCVDRAVNKGHFMKPQIVVRLVNVIILFWNLNLSPLSTDISQFNLTDNFLNWVTRSISLKPMIYIEAKIINYKSKFILFIKCTLHNINCTRKIKGKSLEFDLYILASRAAHGQSSYWTAKLSFLFLTSDQTWADPKISQSSI